MKEEWRSIDGYEGYYEVSNLGRVRRLDNYIHTEIKFVEKRLFKGKVLVNNKNNSGYQTVVLSKNGKSKKCYVHRLVAGAFLNNPNNYPVVNHKDENPSNNFVWINDDGSVDTKKSNLEWCTQKHNMNWNGVLKRVGEKRRKTEEEKKEKRSKYNKAHKEEIRKRSHNWYLEHYEMKGREQKEVLQYNMDGTLQGSYESAEEAKRITGVKHISCVCNGKRTSAGGYLWRWGETRIVYRRNLS